MKANGGVGVWLHFGATWMCVVSFTTSPLCLEERVPHTHFIGDGRAPGTVWMLWRIILPLPEVEPGSYSP
jgi:hypothetical protein